MGSAIESWFTDSNIQMIMQKNFKCTVLNRKLLLEDKKEKHYENVNLH